MKERNELRERKREMNQQPSLLSALINHQSINQSNQIK